MRASEFDYHLPDELIAQSPSVKRDQARLMVINRANGELEHRHVSDLINYLKPGDLVVKNSSKVIPARLHGKRSTGGVVEILLLTPQGEDEWTALIKPGRRIKDNEEILLPNNSKARFIKWQNGVAVIRMKINQDIYSYLEKHGETPFPPYIKADESLRDRYQTVYANLPGSVAAPTAGLHFTNQLIRRLEESGVIFAEVTLHVGLGTFQPVSVDDISEHKMHSERYEIAEKDADKINLAIREGRRVVAIGTTSVRVLESAAELVAGTYQLKASSGETDIFISPGYRFKVVNALLTNFHLPKSTLLMLVSAFSTREYILKAYKTAVDQGYRFYSFGDTTFMF